MINEKKTSNPLIAWTYISIMYFTVWSVALQHKNIEEYVKQNVTIYHNKIRYIMFDMFASLKRFLQFLPHFIIKISPTVKEILNLIIWPIIAKKFGTFPLWHYKNVRNIGIFHRLTLKVFLKFELTWKQCYLCFLQQII